MKLILFILSFLVGVVSAQELAPKNGTTPTHVVCYALKNATIVISPTLTIEKGTLLVKGDKILEVGKLVKIPKDAIEIDCEGKIILPSFIEVNSNIGLPAPTGTHSFFPQLESNKKGAFHWNESIRPETDASQLYTFNEKANEELLKMGFGLVSTHVQDGIMRGTGALFSLGTKNYNKQLILPQSAAYFSFKNGVSNQTYPSSQMGSIALIRQTFYDLNWYQTTTNRETNISLDALAVQLQKPLLFHTDDKLEILRAQKIASEFGQTYHFIGSGNEYQIIPELKKLKGNFILPLNFPNAYDVKDPYIARQIPLSELKHWELAPSNPYLLKKEGLKL